MKIFAILCIYDMMTRWLNLNMTDTSNCVNCWEVCFYFYNHTYDFDQVFAEMSKNQYLSNRML